MVVTLLFRPTTASVLHVVHDTLHAILTVLRMVSSAVIEVDDICPSLGDCLRCQLDVDWEAVTAASLPACPCMPSTADLK